jgi:DNA-binding PadR family transcriptional regulator
MPKTFTSSPLSLAVLALLCEAPMHPYRMQRLIKERGKDRVINVERRASLYQTIAQLRKAGLIAVQTTARAKNRPTRTIYTITEEGRTVALNWLRRILSTPSPEFPAFPAAVSFLALLTPQDASSQLETREQALSRELARLESDFQTWAHLPRLFLLEEELVKATREAELKWVRELIEDLRSGAVTWSEEWLRNFASTFSEE